MVVSAVALAKADRNHSNNLFMKIILATRRSPLALVQAVRDLVRLRVKPEYTAEAYGLPAYLQLSLRGPDDISQGAEDGSEMGVYCHLKQPQREANLRVRLREYLPFGLEYGVIYVT